MIRFIWPSEGLVKLETVKRDIRKGSSVELTSVETHSHFD